MVRLCARGPAGKLAETSLLQPAMTVVCLGYMRRLLDAGVPVHAVAGHSVGEIPALHACGSVGAAEAVELACARGRAMGVAASLREGAMSAITGVPVDEVFAAVEGMNAGSAVTVATVNAPDQAVISGDPDAVSQAEGLFKGREGARTKALRVSGAWHSEHMRPAVEEFSAVLDKTEISSPSIPMVFNREGREAVEPPEIRDLIAGQLVRPVRWDLVMKRFDEMGVTHYVEVGPGKVLRGLLRLNFPGEDRPVHNVNDLRSLDRAARELVSV